MKDSYEKMIITYRKVLKANPGHWETYRDLGIVYLGKGDTERALAYLQKASEHYLGLRNVEIYYHLALACTIKGQGDLAIFNFKKAVECGASRAQLALIYTKMGRLYFEKGDLEEAFYVLKKSHQINSQDFDTCLNLAFVCDEKGLLEEAVPMYNQAFGLSVTALVLAEIQARLGLIYLSFGLVEEAFFISKSALDKSASGLAHAILGAIYLMRGAYSKAIFHYEKRGESSPDDVPSLYNLGLAYKCEARANKIIFSCQKKLEQEPDNSKTLFLLGKNYLSLENYDKAIKALEKSIIFDSKNAQCHYYLAKAFKTAGKGEMALIHFQHYLDLKSAPSANDYLSLGCLHSQCGFAGDAVQAFKQAIEINSQNTTLIPTNIQSYAILGKAYTEKGMIDDAIKLYRRAVLFAPDEDIYFALGAIFLGKELYREAMQAYVKANRVVIFKKSYAFSQDSKTHTAVIEKHDEKELTEGKRKNYFHHCRVCHLAFTEYCKVCQASSNQSKKCHLASPEYCKICHITSTCDIKKDTSYISERQLNQIITDSKMQIRRDPKNQEACNALGDAYGRKELYEESIYYYKKAVKLDPDNADSYARLGKAYYSAGNTSAAIACYEEVFNRDSDNFEICITLAEYFLVETDYDKAIGFCRKIINKKLNLPVSIRIHLCLAEAYRVKKEYKLSIISYEWLLKEGNISTDFIYRNLAECYRTVKDYIKMAEYALDVLRLNSADTEVRRWLADFYYQKGNFDEAMIHYQNLVDSDIGDADVLARLAWIYLLETDK